MRMPQTLEAVDHITRGGRDRFFWALDGNVTPEVFRAHMAGDTSCLDKMGAELVTLQNSSFTCRGKKGSSGGSMIDYIIISRSVVPLVVHVLAVMDAPWGLISESP